MAEVGIRVVRLSWQAPIGRAGKQSLATYRRLVTETVPQIRVLPGCLFRSSGDLLIGETLRIRRCPVSPSGVSAVCGRPHALARRVERRCVPLPIAEGAAISRGKRMEDGPWQAWRSNAPGRSAPDRSGAEVWLLHEILRVLVSAIARFLRRYRADTLAALHWQ